MTFSLFILVAGSFLCGWAVLRCMGNEREQRVRHLEAQIEAEVVAAAEKASAGSAMAVSSSPFAEPNR